MVFAQTRNTSEHNLSWSLATIREPISLHRNNACSACGKNGTVAKPTNGDEANAETDDVRPVTWGELNRLRQDCNRLLAIFAEHVFDVASQDRKADPLKYTEDVKMAVSTCKLSIGVALTPQK